MTKTTFSGSSAASGMFAVLEAARADGLVPIGFQFDFGVREPTVDARVPAAVSQQFWRVLEEESREPLLGWRLGQRLATESFAPFSYLLKSSATLEQAWSLIAPNLWLLFDSGDQAITEVGEREVSIGYRRSGLGEPLIAQAEVCIVTAFEHVCATTLEKLGPHSLHFQSPAPAWAAQLDQRSGVRSHWNARFNGVRLGRSRWDAPIPSHDPKLFELIAFSIGQLNQARPPRRTVIDQLDAWLAQRLENGQPVEAKLAARALGQSTRSLQRTLEGGSTTFSERLDQVRQTLALRWLGEAQRPSEVSHRIGYRDPSQFSRAFRRWTGLTPSAWLEQRGR